MEQWSTQAKSKTAEKSDVLPKQASSWSYSCQEPTAQGPAQSRGGWSTDIPASPFGSVFTDPRFLKCWFTFSLAGSGAVACGLFVLSAAQDMQRGRWQRQATALAGNTHGSRGTCCPHLGTHGSHGTHRPCPAHLGTRRSRGTRYPCPAPGSCAGSWCTILLTASPPGQGRPSLSGRGQR